MVSLLMMPYGYTLDSEGNIIENMDERDAITLILAECKLGTPYPEIIQHLTDAGFYNRNQEPFTRSQISRAWVRYYRKTRAPWTYHEQTGIRYQSASRPGTRSCASRVPQQEMSS